MKHSAGRIRVFFLARPLLGVQLSFRRISSRWSQLSARRSGLVLVFVCLFAAMLTNCGGGSNQAPPPAKDFAITISPSSITQQAGGASSRSLYLWSGKTASPTRVQFR